MGVAVAEKQILQFYTLQKQTRGSTLLNPDYGALARTTVGGTRRGAVQYA